MIAGTKERDGLVEAEKALKKHPHSFQIDDASAALYRAFGFDSADKPNCLDQSQRSFVRRSCRFTVPVRAMRRGARHPVKTQKHAAIFDASPGYDESGIRFITRLEGAGAHDDMGAPAMVCVRNAVSQFDNEKIAALWGVATEE